MAWRSGQPAFNRWLATGVLFTAALLARFALGRLHGANPVIAFYPAILLAALFLGWKQAMCLLVFAVAAGSYLFLPSGMYLQPVAWLIVGTLNVLIIAMLESAARELAAANDRQRLMFQELQHRVANTLQAACGALEIAQQRVITSPAIAVGLLEEATQRLMASADVHRRLNDPALFTRGLGSILRDAVSSVIDRNRVRLSFDIDALDLSFDQMSSLTLLVIEIANNAQKHVFQHDLGSAFSVSVKAAPNHRAMLIIRDDGPGLLNTIAETNGDQRLGQRIIEGLSKQLAGTLSVTPGPGTEMVVEFPLPAAETSPRRHRQHETMGTSHD
ncbi:MAG TPA: sensor histidine kinase [Rhodopila sp.]|nr:sensor histidine kinase [Rhodopila sp.]